MGTYKPPRVVLVWVICELCGERTTTNMDRKVAIQFLQYGVGKESDPIILNHLFCQDEPNDVNDDG